MSACKPKYARNDNTLLVSIPPLKYIIENIVENDFDIEVMLPAGVSPETFEPSPVKMAAIEQSAKVFTTGLLDFENHMISKSSGSKYTPLHEGIELLGNQCSHHTQESGHRHAHGADPHVWTSPKALKIMAANAFRAIAEICPDSARYKVNFENLMLELEKLDSTAASKISASGVGCFVVFHPAFSYYAKDYGLTQIALEVDGKEPSAERLKELVGQLRGRDIKKIFYQREFPRSMVDVLAAEIGAEAVEIDILTENPCDCILRITNSISGL